MPYSFGLSATSTFLSEQISHQQPANSTFHSQQISTSHQPNEQAEVGRSLSKFSLASAI
jgi:hypothetical protein